MNDEYNTLMQLVKQISSPHTIVFNMRKTLKYWFLEYDFLFVRDDVFINNLGREQDWLKSNYIELGNNSFKECVEKHIFKSITEVWENDIEIGSIKVVAWCNQIVEKDTYLFYLFDKFNNYKGLYCHSNWSGKIIHIGNDLKAFFSFPKVNVRNGEAMSDFHLPRLKLSKVKEQTYDKLLNKNEYQILDAEFGFRPDFKFYKNYIEEVILPLTQNELFYSELVLISETKNLLKFNWKINNHTFLFTLDISTDFIDGENFYKKLNEILSLNPTSKLLVPFSHSDFGQEYGLAYLKEHKAELLSKIFKIELI